MAVSKLAWAIIWLICLGFVVMPERGTCRDDAGLKRARREQRIERRRKEPVRIMPVNSARQALPPSLAEEYTTQVGTFLPNQWRLTPAGGKLPLGDFPVSSILDPSRRYLAVIHAGFGDHEVRVVDLLEQKLTSRVIVPNTWVGAAFSPRGDKFFLSGGADDIVYVFPYHEGVLDMPTTVTLRADQSTTVVKSPWLVSGLATDPQTGVLYITCQNKASLYRWDPRTPTKKPQLVVHFVEPHAAPYKVVLHSQRPVAYVSLWGASAVAEVDLGAGSYRLIGTHSHPNELVLSPDGERLFVACANTNFTDVIDLRRREVVETLDCAIYPGMPAGATPNGLAVRPDGKVLAVANADTNHVACFDISKKGASGSLGMIPTGWYPTSVVFGPRGEIVVTNGKGHESVANPKGPNPYNSASEKNGTQYIAGLLKGSLSFISWPDEEQLRRYTQQVLSNSPLRPDLQPPVAEKGNPIPSKLGDASPIRYCVYIVKENRSYDQVLGDMPEGNGDPSLCLFGEKVTPNHHALAREFVLFDNFYVESEVSADGHEWTMGAYATDFVEKTWPLVYGGHGKLTYPAEGHHPLGRPDAGHIWDRAREAGVSYRSYGEWVNGGGPRCNGTTNDPALRNHFDPCYSGFNMNISDLTRAARFTREVDRFERRGEMPRLVIIRLPNDHTAGTKAGMKTPRAFVAENDLALGRIVERLTHSRFWQKMAIFVVEDDAQNGPDHVDAHRTVAYVISPYAKRHFVCHTMYSTASMLRTMELILGLKPMSQFDAAARPLYDVFTATPDYAPYQALPATWPLDEKNSAEAPMQKESAALNLEREDANPDLLFNEIIWKSVHGAESKMPAPVRAAFVRPIREPDDDD